MKDGRETKVESSKPGEGKSRAPSVAFDFRPSTLGRVGVPGGGRRWIARTLAAKFLVAALCVVGGRGAAEAQFLAVFVDGRILPIAGARAVDATTFRLDLPGGGYLEVPLSRVDRVIADEVEEKPRPIPRAVCGTAFVAQALDPRLPFAGEIGAAAKAAGVHPLLVAAVVRAESGFRPWAVSRVGACGLMQLMPSVWLAEGVADPYDPAANLGAGCRHLRALLDRFNDLATALAAYNAGVATVEKCGGIPPYRETREFVRAVLAEFCPPAGHRGGDH